MRKKKAAEAAEHEAMAEDCNDSFLGYFISLMTGQILGTLKRPFSVMRISVFGLFVFFISLHLVQEITRLGILALESMQRRLSFKCLALPQSFLIFPFLIDRSVHPWVSFQLMIQIAPLNLEEIPTVSQRIFLGTVWKPSLSINNFYQVKH